LFTEKSKPIASEHEPTEEASASKPTEGLRHSKESKPTEESKSKPTQVSYSPMSTMNTKQKKKKKRRRLFTEQQTNSPKSSNAKQPSMTKDKSRKLFSPSKIKVCFINL
jgi:hypothetical protein